MALTIAPEVIINHRFRRGGTGKKDRLDKDAARAAELGMSYGQYKAAEREGRLPANTQDDEDEEQEKLPLPPPIVNHDGKHRYVRVQYPPRPCLVCGKMYIPRAINSKYCGEDCRKEAAEIHSKIANAKHRAKAKEAEA